ncbi:MAG: 4Fe-4S binding protein [Peptococcaceae bacterium]|jgi:NADH-quinone oxidoreductase subunit F|nr:4Fe-4S binding protein [Peptococcaceae bacterium]
MKTLLLCCGTGCIAGGGENVLKALGQAITDSGAALEIKIKATGCNGFCENGPIVKVMPDDVSYYKVAPGDAPEIVASAESGQPLERLLYRRDDGTRVKSQADNPFYQPQKKVALRNIGMIDPADIDDYIASGGYRALEKARHMLPGEIIAQVEESGLRGRGGAGFPTGRKWKECASYPNHPKYVVCNGDEGDPGAFMDRSILEGDPHSVIEGLCIAALAIGAAKGFFYIRDEYALALKHVRFAISQARERGYLAMCGEDFDLEVVRGGGAFVCGESTALMASIEGRVGEPRAKYVRSVQRGLWDQPTVLNNVETLANVPVIIANGAESFTRLGTEGSKGTKVFALVGHVRRTGLVEVPMGTTLRELIFAIGGGVEQNRSFKAVQTGGPSGGCIPESMLDLPVDFDSLEEHGAMMGSGGMIIMDDRTCIVEVARYYVKFLSEESCGKCTPCREGLRHLLEILTDICNGHGRRGDEALMREIAEAMREGSLCGLGKTAANPVLTTLEYFPEEYEEHISEGFCRAGVCRGLSSFGIDQSVCTGCGLCKKACPSDAISGETRQPHTIEPARCIACGSCRSVCRFGAVMVQKKAVTL